MLPQFYKNNEIERGNSTASVTGMLHTKLSPACHSVSGEERSREHLSYWMTISPLIGLSIDFVVFLSEVITGTSKDHSFAWPLNTLIRYMYFYIFSSTICT